VSLYKTIGKGWPESKNMGPQNECPEIAPGWFQNRKKRKSNRDVFTTPGIAKMVRRLEHGLNRQHNLRDKCPRLRPLPKEVLQSL